MKKQIKLSNSFKLLFGKIPLVLFLGIFPLAIKAQNGTVSKPNFYPSSPDAAALIKSIDVPVSKTTGVPNISVPIYEIALSDISIPISIDYNSSGIRIDEISGTVGLGWSLNAGGMISSTVSGTSDLDGNGYSDSYFPNDREMDPVSFLQTNGQVYKNSDYELLTNLTGNRIYYGYIDGSVTSPPTAPLSDTQPDIFYFQYPGGSGKFFKTDSGFHTIPFSPINISKSQSFVIKDGSGVKYTFSEVETINITSQGYTNHPEFGGGNSTALNFVYHLSKIETPGGNVIDFSYDDISYSYFGSTDYTRYKTYNPISDFPSTVDTRTETDFKVFGKNLRSISVNGELMVDFIYESCNRIDLLKGSGESGAFALDKIHILKGGVTEVFDFDYSYFNSTSTDFCNETPDDLTFRLKLNSAQKIGEEPYVFSYLGSNSIPDRDNLQVDHWGYFSTLGGKYAVDETGVFLGGNSKEPVLEDTKVGVLGQIKYPTKGVTEFVYELNEARDTLGLLDVQITNKSAGVFYDPGYSTQTEVFTVQSESGNYVPVTVMYNTTPAPAQANLRFDVTLSGPNGFWQQFQSVNGYENVSLSLLEGTYTITVEQVGIFEDGYVNILWAETEITYTEEIGDFPLGGLRVREIREKDRENGPVLKSTFYEYLELDNPTVSSGKVANKPKYRYTIDKMRRSMTPENNGLMDLNITYFVQSSSSALPLSGLSGFHVLYTEVKESNSSPNENGYIYSKYSFVNDLKAYATFPAVAPTSFNWMRGLLLEEVYYKKDVGGQEFKKVRSIENEYEHLYTKRSASNFNEAFAHYTPPAELNESHALGLSIELIAPEWHFVDAHAGGEYRPAIFRISSFKLISSWTKKTKTIATEYNGDGTSGLISQTEYFYDNPIHAQMSRSRTTNSDGLVNSDYVLYPDDFTGGNAALTESKNNGLFAIPVEQVKIVEKGGTPYIVNAVLNEYLTGGKGQLNKVYSFVPGTGVPLTQFKFSNSLAGNLPSFQNLGNYSKDQKYIERFSIDSYDSKGNPLKMVDNSVQISKMRWEGNFNLVNSICKNCQTDFFASTSFESTDKGGWTYSGAPVTSYKKTGAKGYNLSSGSVGISSIPNPSSKYKVGFWARRTSGTGNVNVGGQTESLTTAWKWVEKTISSSSLTISGSSVVIDELRLHPLEAFVESYTYTQNNKVATKTDFRGYASYYEYDNLGRLVTIKDEDGYIIEQYEYNYASGN